MKFRVKDSIRVELEARQRLMGDYSKLRVIKCHKQNSKWLSQKWRELNSARYPSEVKIAGLFAKAGITDFLQNYPLMNRWFGDFFFEKDRIVVEYDGAHHREEEQRAKDHFKDWALTLMGYRVIRWDRTTNLRAAVALLGRELSVQSGLVREQAGLPAPAIKKLPPGPMTADQYMAQPKKAKKKKRQGRSKPNSKKNRFKRRLKALRKKTAPADNFAEFLEARKDPNERRVGTTLIRRSNSAETVSRPHNVLPNEQGKNAVSQKELL